MALNLVPKIEGDGILWRFLGHYSLNREEWMQLQIANMFNSVTQIALYDTLGDSALEYVINQTKLTTICCASPQVDKLLRLKGEGVGESLVNLVSFDPISPEQT